MKICKNLEWDGGEMSYCTCKICDYGFWVDSSVSWPRPNECPYLDRIACFRINDRKESE